MFTRRLLLMKRLTKQKYINSILKLFIVLFHVIIILKRGKMQLKMLNV